MMRFYFLRLSFLLLSLTSVFGQDSGSSSVSGNYLLRPKDVFRIEVFQEPDLTKELRIAADGSVVLPLIGQITVGDRTVEEAQRLITELYDRDYLVNPHVNLLVLEYTESLVTVLGQVNRPGAVPIPPEEEMTLTKAISGAAGHTRLGNLKNVRLTRTDALGKPQIRRINFEEISKGKAKDVILKDGDSIYIEERVF